MSGDLPERIGDYRVLRRLGKGGMGEVFLAQKRGVKGVVTTRAVKRIHSSNLTDPDFEKALEKEARIAGLLNHPNLVRGDELIPAGDSYALVMEYVDGADLAEILHACRVLKAEIPVRTALALMYQVAEGLHHAHELKDNRGRHLDLVHRDLKPANIHISRAGAVKVMDFGIARAAISAIGTLFQGRKGTYQYMAPEQAKGSSAIDRRADIYSMGAVLYELLTLQKLHTPRATLEEKLAQIINGDIEERLALAPPATCALLRNALAKDPSRRFATARGFADEVATVSKTYPEGPPLNRQLEHLVDLAERETAEVLRVEDLSFDIEGSEPQPNAGALQADLSDTVRVSDEETLPKPDAPAEGQENPESQHEPSTDEEWSPFDDPRIRAAVKLGGAALVIAAVVLSAVLLAIEVVDRVGAADGDGGGNLHSWTETQNQGSAAGVDPPVEVAPSEPLAELPVPIVEDGTSEVASEDAPTLQEEPSTPRPPPPRAPTKPVTISHTPPTDLRLMIGKRLSFDCTTPGHTNCVVFAWYRKAGDEEWQPWVLKTEGETHSGSVKVTGEYAPKLEYYISAAQCGGARWPSGADWQEVKVR